MRIPAILALTSLFACSSAHLAFGRDGLPIAKDYVVGHWETSFDSGLKLRLFLSPNGTYIYKATGLANAVLFEESGHYRVVPSDGQGAWISPQNVNVFVGPSISIEFTPDRTSALTNAERSLLGDSIINDQTAQVRIRLISVDEGDVMAGDVLAVFNKDGEGRVNNFSREEKVRKYALPDTELPKAGVWPKVGVLQDPKATALSTRTFAKKWVFRRGYSPGT